MAKALCIERYYISHSNSPSVPVGENKYNKTYFLTEQIENNDFEFEFKTVNVNVTNEHTATDCMIIRILN